MTLDDGIGLLPEKLIIAVSKIAFSNTIVENQKSIDHAQVHGKYLMLRLNNFHLTGGLQIR